MASLVPSIPIVMPFLIYFIVWIFLYLVRRHYRNKGLRLPFTNSFFRSPGQSLLEEIDGLNEQITEYIVCLLSVPIAIYAIYVSYLFTKQGGVKLSDLAIFGIVMPAVIGICLYKTSSLLAQRRRARLGYDGEVAVGQELNQLLREGYYVFHDLPADKSNIDHIAVGRKGVFAVETKARSKPTSENRQKGATVEYDGRALHFPRHTDTKILEQAERQVKWLSKWISSAIGEDIAARAIVALPGWYVKRTSSEGISVVNPKQFTSFFEHVGPRELSEEMIKRIVHQLDQKCRDVDPVSTITEEEKTDMD